MKIMKNPNDEFEAAKKKRTYLTDIGSELHYQALERIVKRFNSGRISEAEADKRISYINDVRNKYLDIKSERYTPMSIQKLESIYLACT